MNGRSVVPSVVVPSGKIATMSPRASAVAASRLIECAWCRRSRSTNSVPTLADSRPTTGQRRISALPTKRAGESASSTKMSSHEMWFATISRLPGRPPSGTPWKRASMRRIRSRRADQRRTISRRRVRSTNGKMTYVVAMPSTTWSPIRAVRARRNGSAMRRGGERRARLTTGSRRTARGTPRRSCRGRRRGSVRRDARSCARP